MVETRNFFYSRDAEDWLRYNGVEKAIKEYTLPESKFEGQPHGGYIKYDKDNPQKPYEGYYYGPDEMDYIKKFKTYKQAAKWLDDGGIMNSSRDAVNYNFDVENGRVTAKYPEMYVSGAYTSSGKIKRGPEDPHIYWTYRRDHDDLDEEGRRYFQNLRKK